MMESDDYFLLNRELGSAETCAAWRQSTPALLMESCRSQGLLDTISCPFVGTIIVQSKRPGLGANGLNEQPPSISVNNQRVHLTPSLSSLLRHIQQRSLLDDVR
ncbi:unnamed protein product [Nezara viridula]|uniref:Uncharacterized protein n=1 Tax=Nezara viridula TaxID=85310 RepID=A0A9P0GZJ3_NEZVI|nr:unnamed protein product [Nezara viridula]